MEISSQDGDWLQFSKKPTSCALASPSRKDAFQFRLPQNNFPRNASGEVVVSSTTRASTDPFDLKNIPPLSLLEKWKNELSFFAKEAKGYYDLELGSQCFTMSNIQDVIKTRHARDLATKSGPGGTQLVCRSIPHVYPHPHPEDKVGLATES